MRKIDMRYEHPATIVYEIVQDLVIRVEGELRDLVGFFEGKYFYSPILDHSWAFQLYVVTGEEVRVYDICGVSYPRPTERRIEVNGKLEFIFQYLCYKGPQSYKVSGDREVEVRKFVRELLDA